MAAFRGTRRSLLAAAVGAVPARSALAAEAPPPTDGKVLRVLDCCGSFQLTLAPLKVFRRSRGSLISRYVYQEAPGAKLVDRIRPSGDPSEPGFDLVFALPDALIDAIDQGLLLKLVPEFSEQLPKLEQVLSRPAWQMQSLARGYGVVTAFSPVGPLLNYIAARVAPVPRTPGEFLEWARAHPRRFTYADPVLADGSRAFLMSLPYALGDRDPKDPENGWSKTWEFLQELGKTIDSYPASADVSFKAMKTGTLDVCVSSLTEDLGSRMSEAANPHCDLMELQGVRWIGSAFYAALPGTVAAGRIPVLLELISFLLTQEAQAFAYGRGSFYPGPAIDGVGLDRAPPISQALIGPAARPIYARLIDERLIETPLAPAALRYALARWKDQIAGGR